MLPGQVWGPRRIKPNEHTYRLITRICREAGLLTEAMHAYRGMRRHEVQFAQHEPANLLLSQVTAGATSGGHHSLLPSSACAPYRDGSFFSMRQLPASCRVMGSEWIAVGRMGFRPSNMEWREMISVAVEAAMAEKDGGDLAQQACTLVQGSVLLSWFLHGANYLDMLRLGALKVSRSILWHGWSHASRP